MKKSLKFAVNLFFMVCLCSQVVCAQTPIKPQGVFNKRPIHIVVGGEKLETDVAPVIINGRVMLPLRAVFESIGAQVEYDSLERKITAYKDSTFVEFVVDSNIMKINNKEKELDVPAFISNSRTLVPLRACAEAFNLDVEWNQNTYTAKVRKETSLLSEEMVNGVLTKYEYDQNGNLIYTEDSSGIWKKYVYDENENKLYIETAYGKGDIYTYDSRGNLIYRKINDTDYYKYEYDENNNVIYSGSSDEWAKYTYSDNWRKRTSKSSYGGEGVSLYDDRGNLIYWDGTNSQYDSRSTDKFTYNEWGFLTLMESSSGKWEKYEYNNDGKLIYMETSSGNWSKYEYDVNGNLIYEEDAKGAKNTYEYDANGNLIYSIRKANSGRYEHDVNGNLIYLEDSLASWINYKYDEDGNLIYEEHDSNISGNPKISKTYKYDENGNLVYREDTSGNWAKYIVKIV